MKTLAGYLLVGKMCDFNNLSVISFAPKLVHVV